MPFERATPHLSAPNRTVGLGDLDEVEQHMAPGTFHCLVLGNQFRTKFRNILDKNKYEFSFWIVIESPVSLTQIIYLDPVPQARRYDGTIPYNPSKQKESITAHQPVASKSPVQKEPLANQ